MKGVVLAGDRRVEILDFPDPSPGPGEVVIEIKSSGMCGSDLKFYRAAGGAAALGYHPVYLAMAIGCGSKPGMWMNDSGFWIIGKMSGFSEGHTLRTATVMMTVMGVAGLVATVLGAWLLPLV